MRSTMHDPECGAANGTHRIAAFRNLAVLAVCVGILAPLPGLMPMPADAKKPEWAGQKGGKPAKAGKPDKAGKVNSGRGDLDVGGFFTIDVRLETKAWHAYKYGPNGCPPGLAKKRNGCLPPGQAKKRYSIGQPLSASIKLGDLPVDLRVLLPPPPVGHVYAQVDGDVLLVAEATRKVIDAIVLLSAL